MGKPEFRFLESSPRLNLYGEAPVLVWDPSGYRATVDRWYSAPDYPFFETFFAKRLVGERSNGVDYCGSEALFPFF